MAAFFSTLERARRIIVDFPRADEPRLRLRRLRFFDVALPVLADSTEPLTPEEIIQRARTRFGIDAVILSIHGAENALITHPEIFRLYRRLFGLRQHFVSSRAAWTALREAFVQLLRRENRPISTIEVRDKQSVALPSGVNSYELAEDSTRRYSPHRFGPATLWLNQMGRSRARTRQMPVAKDSCASRSSTHSLGNV